LRHWGPPPAVRLTFIYLHMRPLIEAGRVYIAMPPLYRVDIGKETHWAADDADKERIVAKYVKGNVKVRNHLLCVGPSGPRRWTAVAGWECCMPRVGLVIVAVSTAGIRPPSRPMPRDCRRTAKTTSVVEGVRLGTWLASVACCLCAGCASLLCRLVPTDGTAQWPCPIYPGIQVIVGKAPEFAAAFGGQKGGQVHFSVVFGQRSKFGGMGAPPTAVLLTFIDRHRRQMIEAGRVCIAMPPLYRVDIGKETHWAADDADKARILAKYVKGNAKSEITRFKGLGEMMPKVLWETTLNPKTRRLLRVDIDDAIATDRIINELMGKDASARFRFIMDRAEEVEELDV
jgi:hypothetical protein